MRTIFLNMFEVKSVVGFCLKKEAYYNITNIIILQSCMNEIIPENQSTNNKQHFVVDKSVVEYKIAPRIKVNVVYFGGGFLTVFSKSLTVDINSRNINRINIKRVVCVYHRVWCTTYKDAMQMVFLRCYH